VSVETRPPRGRSAVRGRHRARRRGTPREPLDRSIEATNWNITRTAALFQLSRNTVRARSRRYGLRPPEELAPSTSPSALRAPIHRARFLSRFLGRARSLTPPQTLPRRTTLVIRLVRLARPGRARSTDLHLRPFCRLRRGPGDPRRLRRPCRPSQLSASGHAA